LASTAGTCTPASSALDATAGFEVIAGKSMPAEGSAKCFGFVQTYDLKPKRRLFGVLRSQGMQMNQQVTFFTDGGEDVRELPLYLNPHSEQYLDWFHLAMRITVMSQLAKGLRSRDHPDVARSVLDELERLKWFLWHGNVFRALQTVDGLEFDLDGEGAGPEQRKLLQAVTEFGGYIRANASSITNYGERHRNGETISSAFVESVVNQVISKRMVKSNRCVGLRKEHTCYFKSGRKCSMMSSEACSSAGIPPSSHPPNQASRRRRQLPDLPRFCPLSVSAAGMSLARRFPNPPGYLLGRRSDRLWKLRRLRAEGLLCQAPRRHRFRGSGRR
jgi:hypothetical protein